MEAVSECFAVDLLIATSEHYEGLEQWDAVLALSQVIARRSSKDWANAVGKQVKSLLHMGQEGAARKLFDQPGAPGQAVLEAATFFHSAKAWMKALPLFKRLSELPGGGHPKLQAAIVMCLLRAGMVDEAEKYYAAEDVSAEVLILAVQFFQRETNDWARALPLHERIAACFDEFKDQAVGFQVECLLHLGRHDEAKAIYGADGAPEEALVAAFCFYVLTNDTGNGKALKNHMESRQFAKQGGNGKVRRGVACSSNTN